MNDYNSTLKSLLELLNLNEEDIESVLDFVYLESTDERSF